MPFNMILRKYLVMGLIIFIAERNDFRMKRFMVTKFKLMWIENQLEFFAVV